MMKTRESRQQQHSLSISGLDKSSSGVPFPGPRQSPLLRLSIDLSKPEGMPSAKPFVVLPKYFGPKKSVNGVEPSKSPKKPYGKEKRPDKFSKSNTTRPKQEPISWYNESTLSFSTDDLLIKPEEPWFSQYKCKEALSSSDPSLCLPNDQSNQLSDKLNVLYKSQHELYLQKLSSAGGVVSDKNWLNSVIKAGTWSDKIAALSLKVQESPFYNLEALDLLVGIALNKDLRTAGMAIEALKDLFVNSILPDRPLYTFTQLPVKHPEFTAKQALLGWFEKELRSRYSQVLEVIDKGLKANLMYFRRQSMLTVFDLLKQKPEQENKLLYLLVNKLGDSEGKIVSKASELLKDLLKSHPVMKYVVVYEVRVFIQRSLSHLTTLFAAITFLNQITVQSSEEKVAVLLAECYLSLFELALAAKEKGSRLLSALLTGINRVFPRITVLGDLVKYVDTIFRLAHTARSKMASTQALILLSHMVFDTHHPISSKQKNGEKEDSSTGKPSNDAISEVANRFYQALYNKLLSDQVQYQSNTLFLNLLYRSLIRDTNIKRTMAFVKRIALLSLHTAPTLCTGLLLILSEVLQKRPQLTRMITGTEAEEVKKSDADDDEGSVISSSTTAGDMAVFSCYDANKRDPRYACSGVPVLHELSLLRQHYHPSVRAFALALIEPPHGIQFEGDPFVEFSSVAFLDRLAFKNPKQSVAEKLKKKSQEMPINVEMEEFGGDGEEEVAPDKQFFFKYFGERKSLMQAGKVKSKRRKQKELEGREDLDEEEEEEMDAYANKLAEDMIRSNDLNGDEDWDEDGEGWDGDGADGEGEDDDNDEGDWDEGIERGGGEEEEMEGEDEDEAFDFEDFKLPSKGADKTAKKGKGKEKTKKRERGEDFADAEEYEEEMEKIVQMHSLEHLEKELKKKNKKGKK